MTRGVSQEVASVIFAAGKGSRMLGYEGNKTLLPLVPKASLYEGEHPLLVEVLGNLPPGPKGIVVHHRREDVESATGAWEASYLLQPVTNGTGGALLAARPFLDQAPRERVVITMGDVPLIRPATYEKLVAELAAKELVVLAFAPKDRAQYGMLEMEGERVLRIVEWKYWREFSPERQSSLRYCNAGVYAARRKTLVQYLDLLAVNPHEVKKKRGDEWVTIQEYFLTDLVEMMGKAGLPVGVVLAEEEEVMGVDTPEALKQAQALYARTLSSRSGIPLP